MADLNKLFGKKKETPNVQPKEHESKGEAETPVVAGAEASAPVESKPADSTAPQVAAKPKPKLAFLKSAASAPVTGAAGRNGGASKQADSDPVLPQTLDDLANLEVAGRTPKKERELVSFPDEVPATAPIRELPEGLEPQQLEFVELMDSVHAVLHEPDLLGNVIKRIMIELKSQDHLMKLVSDDDIQLWIRAMRETMGLAKIQKTEAKAKRGSSSRSKKVDHDMLDDLASLGIGLADGGD